MKKNRKNQAQAYDIPLSRAWIIIFLSTLLISGLAWMGWLYNLHLKEKSMHDEQYNIIAIVQSSQQKESLKTLYLAELLNLSIDKPMNLYQFNVRQGIKNLLACPLIKEAKIKKIKPGTLHVDYTMRVPIAYLGDFSNTAVDQDGYLFPFTPFFTPKKISTILIGTEMIGNVWGKNIVEKERWHLALQVLQEVEKLSDEFIFIKQIDVSHAFAESYGKKQIVVVVEENLNGQVKPIFLRLHTEDYKHGLANFFVLRKNLIKKESPANLDLVVSKKEKPSPIIIDFRIPGLAFFKPPS